MTSGTTPTIVIATILRKSGATGVQRHVQTFREFGQAVDRGPVLVTPFDSRSAFLRPVFGARRLIEPVSSSASVWWYRHWHQHFLTGALRPALIDRSVVYAQCPVSAAAALAVRAEQPVAMAVHFNVSQAEEWADKGAIERGGRVYENILSLERQVIPRLDGLVFVSDFMRQVVHERLPEARDLPYVVAPNFLEVAPDCRAAPTRDLVTIGALEPRKNHGYLLEILTEAARRGHRYSLTIIGDGPDRQRLEKRAAELGISDLVEFTGFEADPRSVLRQHRLYCHTATMESFGIVVTEAMAEGLPVLVAATGGLREIVRPGLDGDTWPLDDPESAAERLIALVEDPGTLARMGAAARDGALTRYSSGRQGPRLLDFLSRLQIRRDGSPDG